MTTRGLGDSMTQRGRGRPSTGVKVQVRIPADALRRIDAEAARTGETRAALLRLAVYEWCVEHLEP